MNITHIHNTICKIFKMVNEYLIDLIMHGCIWLKLVLNNDNKQVLLDRRHHQ